MHVDFDIYDCDGSDNIDIDVDAYVFSIYSFAYAGLGLVGAVSAVMFHKRRRRIETMDEATEAPKGGDFEMMSDEGVVAQMTW